MVGFALALWLITSAFAASPQLHQLLHKDSQDPNHYCLFTQLSQHSTLTAVTTTPVPEPSWIASNNLFVPLSELLPSFDYGVSYGRAPPSLLASIAVVG